MIVLLTPLPDSVWLVPGLLLLAVIVIGARAMLGRASGDAAEPLTARPMRRPDMVSNGQHFTEVVRRELIQQLSLRLQLLTPAQLEQLQQEAEARAAAEAEAAAAARRAEQASAPLQSPIQLPLKQ